MGNRDKGGPLRSYGSAQVPICKYMQRSLLQVVRVREEQSTSVKPLDDQKRSKREQIDRIYHVVFS